MKNLPIFCFAMAILSLLAACKSEPTGGELNGSYWTLSAATISGKAVKLSQGNDITLVFADGKLNGKAPCNSYFSEYSIKGANISLGDLGVTKMMCDEMEQEITYLSLLSKAQTFTVGKDKLELFSPNGQLTFFRMKDNDAETLRYSEGVGKLAAQFPVLEGDALLHLHPIVRVDNPGNYPYQGTLIDTSYYQFFSSDIREIWANGGGDVFAVGQYGGFYICRIPGRYVSSDIALFSIKGSEMRHIETVAWAWCDEGWCNQQDAWLTDTDRDGRTDVVQHYTLTDDQGKLKEERLILLLQTESGNILVDDTAQLNKGDFKMARI